MINTLVASGEAVYPRQLGELLEIANTLADGGSGGGPSEPRLIR